MKWIEREKVELNSLVSRLSLVSVSLHELLTPQKNHQGLVINMCTHTEKSLGMRLRTQYVTATWVTISLSLTADSDSGGRGGGGGHRSLRCWCVHHPLTGVLSSM